MLSVLNIVFDKDEGNEIRLGKGEPWWPRASPSYLELVPRLVHLPTTEKQETFRNKTLDSMDVAAVQRELSRSMENIKYQRGCYNLSIRFGCIALSGRGATVKDIGKKHPVKALLNAIDSGVVISMQVKRW